MIYAEICKYFCTLSLLYYYHKAELLRRIYRLFSRIVSNLSKYINKHNNTLKLKNLLIIK